MEKVAKAGIKKEKGWLYFIDKDGDVSRAVQAKGRQFKGRKSAEKLTMIGVKKEKGWLYFLDKQGDISRARMRNA